MLSSIRPATHLLQQCGGRAAQRALATRSHAVLDVSVDVRSEDFAANAAHMRTLVDDLKAKTEHAMGGGGEKAMARHVKRGKLTPRQRIAQQLDAGAPFLELSHLAGLGLYGKDDVPCGGLITGIGRVEGVECMIIANDPTIKGGSYYPIGVRKQLRAQEIAYQNRLPCIYHVESGGANLPYQSELFPDAQHFGRHYMNQANMSADGIAQVSVVFGSCTAGAAYVPAMSDEVVMVKDKGFIYLGGPPLTKAATGEIVTDDELGGADLHCRTSGVADHYAQDDEHAVQLARRSIANANMKHKLPRNGTQAPVVEPLYDMREAYGIVPRDPLKQYDARLLLARLLDGSEFDEFKPLYGSTLVTGFGRIHGQPVGILANNGILFSDSALKGAHFIQLCGQRNIPILFQQNISGFMVGRTYEAGGIAKDGAKMVSAMSSVKVPRLTLVVGGSHGAGNFAMCGRGLDPRFMFMWPNARISVMGGLQAASVLAQVRRDGLKPGQEWPEEDEEKFKAAIRGQYEKEGHPYYASARLWDDGIIDPADTRRIIGLALAACTSQAPVQPTKFGVFRF